MTYKKKAIPQATRRAVAVRYGCEPGEGKRDVPCYWCGTPGEIVWFRRGDGEPSGWVWFSHELDHLLPEIDGGTGEPDNIVLACRSCNRSRRHWNHSGGAPESLRSASGNIPPGREGKGTGKGKGSLFPIHLPTVTVPRANRADDGWAADAAIGGGR